MRNEAKIQHFKNVIIRILTIITTVWNDMGSELDLFPNSNIKS